MSRIRTTMSARLMCAALLAATVAGTAPATAVDSEERASVTATSGDAQMLSEPAQGRAALRALGDDLSAAAALNNTTPKELSRLLREDDTMWLDRAGRLYAVDPAPAPLPEAAANVEHPVGNALASVDSVGQMHSKPGAPHTIYLDFDGYTLPASSTWVIHGGASAGTLGGWDPAGDGPVVSAVDAIMMLLTYEYVRSYFSAFDVDVTTESPTGTWSGSHVAFVQDDGLHNALCAQQCGGIAYLNAWGTNTASRPAFVFPGSLQGLAKNVGDVAAHEIGHNFGLYHDGTSSQEYYPGHAPWAPIMGTSYTEPVVQWSHGTYSDASRPDQDDVALIAAKAGLTTDETSEHREHASSPVPLAYITTREDVDMWNIGRCSGDVSVKAYTDGYGQSLDVDLQLFNAAGTWLAGVNPPVEKNSANSAFGMSAEWAGQLNGITYVRINGAGAGDPRTSYDDYGSIGGYRLEVTGCDTSVIPPGPVRNIRPTWDLAANEVVITWDAPQARTPTASYTVRLGSVVRTVSADTRRVTFSGLPRGTAQTVTIHGTSTGSVNGASATARVPVPAATTTSLTPATSGSTVALHARVSGTGEGPAPTGTVVFRLGSIEIARSEIDAAGTANASGTLPVGRHVIAAEFVPSTDLLLSSTTSATVNITAPEGGVPSQPTPTLPAPAPGSRATSTLTISAPRTARLGTRPRLKIRLSSPGQAATGTLIVKYRGVFRTYPIAGDRVSLRLPQRIRRVHLKRGKLRLTVTYTGSPTVQESRAKATIRVRR